MPETASELIAYCRENGRICPVPPKWSQLYELLPHRRRSGTGWEPPLPLILMAWHDTPGFAKTLRLTEHIEWAATHGALDLVGAFIRDLPEDEWFHLGE